MIMIVYNFRLSVCVWCAYMLSRRAYSLYSTWRCTSMSIILVTCSPFSFFLGGRLWRRLLSLLYHYWLSRLLSYFRFNNCNWISTILSCTCSLINFINGSCSSIHSHHWRTLQNYILVITRHRWGHRWEVFTIFNYHWRRSIIFKPT